MRVAVHFFPAPGLSAAGLYPACIRSDLKYKDSRMKAGEGMRAKKSLIYLDKNCT